MAAALIRSVIIKRGGSIPVSLTITRDIHNVTFDNNDIYKKQPAKRKKAVDRTVGFAATSGLDGAGAYSAEIPGGFHDGGSGVDQFSRLTATIKDNKSKRLYFYRTTDGTFWDRIHIPEDKNHQTGKIYVHITEEQFNKKQKPQHP